MKKFILILIILNLSAGCSLVNVREYEQKVKETEKKVYTDFHYAAYGDKSFYRGLNDGDGDENIKEKKYGGIVSHHILVSEEIARFFREFRGQNVGTFVIIGPNHFEAGEENILVSKYPYNTPWGLLEPNEKYIDELVDSGLVFNEERPFLNEHSIATLVSYIKYYFPEAKIVPIILKRRVSGEEASGLSRNLNDILTNDDVVIASVDFSHHLNTVGANFHDDLSVSVIRNFEFGRIYALEIDSPPTIYTLLRYLDERSARRMVYENVNAAEYTGDLDLDDVTSYVFAHFLPGEKEGEAVISFLNFGDMMFDRDVKGKMKAGIDPLEKIKGVEGNFLKAVDFIIANLEGPITKNTNCSGKAYSFRFEPGVAGLLKRSGFNLLNLANNHTTDCYQAGLDETKLYLSGSGINYFGDYPMEASYFTKQVGDKKITFVGLDNTWRRVKIDEASRLIARLKQESDYVLVNIHWGFEYSKTPSQEQKRIAYALVDNGADVILGHHPHVIQPLEIYKEGVIFYSLGNFLFDQAPMETRRGLGVGVVLKERKKKFYLFPLEIKNFQPTFLEYEEMENFCEDFLAGIETDDLCSFER